MALPHSLDIMKYPARYQFGQPGAPCGGRSCCTDTVIQMVVDYYKEDHYSLSDIRRVAQNGLQFNEAACTGLNNVEVLNALDRLGVKHYQVAFGVDAGFVWDKLDIGPVMVGVHYGSYPSAKGACGHNNAEVGGKTDCDFNGSHMVLAIDKRRHDAPRDFHRDFFVRDPDHNSPSRPERPDFDRIRRHDLQVAMENLPRFTAFTNTYVIHPTRRKNLNRL